jgi:Fuc2NAc and GlcNAc transferase
VGSAAVFSGSIFLRGLTSEAPTGLDVLLFVFGVFYITATANYYNFMDGINGIAGLTGIIAFSGVGLFGLFENKDMVWVATAFCIAAACLGFLPLNFPRAKVFLGDVGSVLLGFLFASWILWFSQSVLEFVVLASLLFPFYIDELSTLLVRIKEREKLTQAHRRHIYQILVNQAGLSHAVVTMCYGIIQILVAVSVWMMMRKGFLAVAVLLVVLSVLFFFGAMRIRRSFKGNGIGQFDVI